VTEENQITDYRCSRCGQIGGDSQTGPYSGCPMNGGKNHDMAGGKV
jgi:DNA-directed RNA polymerase subunit RPC12/RpoP